MAGSGGFEFRQLTALFVILMLPCLYYQLRLLDSFGDNTADSNTAGSSTTELFQQFKVSGKKLPGIEAAPQLLGYKVHVLEKRPGPAIEMMDDPFQVSKVRSNLEKKPSTASRQKPEAGPESTEKEDASYWQVEYKQPPPNERLYDPETIPFPLTDGPEPTGYKMARLFRTTPTYPIAEKKLIALPFLKAHLLCWGFLVYRGARRTCRSASKH